MDRDYNQAIEHYHNLIDKLVTNYKELIIGHTQKINSSEKNKILSGYSIVLIGLLESIFILLKNENYHSITSITRNILECYVKLTKFFSFYPDDIQFIFYFQYQNYLDLNERKKILKRIIEENNSQNNISNQESIDLLTKNLIDIIKIDFSDFFTYIDTNNLPDSIYQTIDLIKNSFPPTVNTRKPIYQEVGETLKNNQAYKNDNLGKEYEGSIAVYGDLCLFSHQNIGAIEDRILDNSGNILFNKPYRNLPADLTVSYYCALDIFNKLKVIIS